MPSVTNLSAFAFSEAVVSLYPALPNGEPDYANPIWLGAAVQGGSLGSDLNVRRRDSTGSTLPRYIPGGQSHRLTLNRVWTKSEGQRDWRPDRTPCVAELTWRDAVTGLWSRDRFYGVQAVSGQWSADGLYAFGVDQQFVAAARQNVGGRGLLPEQAGLIDVHWRRGDVSLHLHRYATATGTYTEVVPGTAAALAVELASATGAVSVGGEEWLTLSGGGLSARNRVIGTGGELPPVRLDYRAGDRWLGSLARSGFYVPAFATVAGPLALPADGVAFRSGATVVGTLRPDQLRYLGFTFL